MEFTKFGHACVRITDGERRVVIDPGSFTEGDAVDGATDILITHEHFDHFSEENIARALADNPELQIWTNGAVADLLAGKGPNVHVVGHGDTFEAGGFAVRVFGEMHAEIHRDIPRIKNIGFMIDDTVFHPGDALTVPDVPVETLMLPVNAPWSRVGEVIDYVREVKPQKAYAVHDGLLSDMGFSVVNRLVGQMGNADYERIVSGTSRHLH